MSSVLESQQSNTKVGDYSIYVVTWNVGSRFPDNISLRTLLGLSHNNNNSNRNDDTKIDSTTLPDIYAVGLQEVNSQPQNQVLGLFKEDPWTHKIIETLNCYDYVVIKTEQMQGLLLSLFLKREHVLHLTDIEAEFTRTGFGGIWGNKGAVSIRLNIYGCGLVFIAAHLAAHDQHLNERIEDYKQIIENHHYHVKHFREIHDHDYIFWFGDLNFRLEGDDTPIEVRNAVLRNLEEDNYAALLQRDQLLLTRETKQEAFQLLHERLPAFPPTFKFKEGTSEYDMKRRPAWTDRILYAVQPLNKHPNKPLAIEQHSYKSQPSYMISDHKPVTSEFTIKLFPNYRSLGVTFANITAWPIGQEYTVEYTKPLDFEERDHDWIGIYPVGYTSFRDYISYEYVNQADTPSSTDSPPMDDYFDNPEGRHRNRHGHHGRHAHHNRDADGTRHQRLTRHRMANEETIRLEFCEDLQLKHGKEYVLIYFSNTGLRGVSSVSGISNTFRAENRSTD